MSTNVHPFFWHVYCFQFWQYLLDFLLYIHKMFQSKCYFQLSFSWANLWNFHLFHLKFNHLLFSNFQFGLEESILYTDKCMKKHYTIVHLKFLSFISRVCFVGNHLVSSSSYNTCSKNDSKLQNLYYTNSRSSSSYFNASSVFTATSIPGITGNVFKGIFFVICMNFIQTLLLISIYFVKQVIWQILHINIFYNINMIININYQTPMFKSWDKLQYKSN